VFRLPSCRCNEVRWRNQDPAFVGARRIRVREREGRFTGKRGLCAPQHGNESKMPDEKLTGHLVLATSYWLASSHALARYPCGLDRLPVSFPARRVLCSTRHAKSKNPDDKTHRGFCSGDVLLSHGLSPYYHRGCSVSLPCSKWERVVPLRYSHQSREALTLLGSGE
jgi:hypothetical protein